MQYFLALVYSYLDFFVNVAYISLFMIPALHLLKVSIFFVSKLIVFVVCFPKYLKNFFMQSSPLYTTCLFFISSYCPYRRGSISAGNMFTFFWCGRFFRIIFTSVYFVNLRFKIPVNNRYCLC